MVTVDPVTKSGMPGLWLLLSFLEVSANAGLLFS